MNPGGLAHEEEMLGRTKVERAGDRVVRPFQPFAQRQASGGLVLLGCAIVALAWANSPWAWAYEQMLGVPLGIMVGLVLGKSVGIGLASWLAVKTGLAALPEGATWRQLIGTAFLAGIGFTMALFIGGLAFADTHFEREAQLADLDRFVAGRGGRYRHCADV
ncbi:Na+/H+ antiporter NhaA, partial [Marinobacterium sedimentorum]|uniref:Na+/H+ antiporter NhaA n=1 Tax=Marinobacterium sedimentorum TaxID=2927804 RepID=UPI0020C72F74